MIWKKRFENANPFSDYKDIAAIADLAGKVTAISLEYSRVCNECAIYAHRIVDVLRDSKIDVKIFMAPYNLGAYGWLKRWPTGAALRAEA